MITKIILVLCTLIYTWRIFEWAAITDLQLKKINDITGRDTLFVNIIMAAIPLFIAGMASSKLGYSKNHIKVFFISFSLLTFAVSFIIIRKIRIKRPNFYT